MVPRALMARPSRRIGGLLAAAVLHGAACGRPPAPPASLVVACPAIPPSITTRSGDEMTNSVLRNAFEPLVDFKDDLSVSPALVESWHNPDPFTWVFVLRPDLRRHDGKVLEAGDVVRFLNDASGPSGRRRAERYVASVEAPDARTLVLRTREPTSILNSFFGANLVHVEREGGLAVGTGPYLVREFVPGQRIVLEAFDQHRDGPPSIRRAEFRAVADGAARAALVTRGEAHLALDVPAASFRAASSAPGVRALASRGLRSVHLGLNAIAERRTDGSPNPFRDRRVREAVALAIDKPALVRGPLDGYADVMHELVPPGVFGHHGGIPPRGPDPARARGLLAEAGHPRGFEARLAYIADRYRGMEGVVSALGQQLAAIGIQVRPQPLSLAGFRRAVSEAGEGELFLVSWLISTGDAAAAFNVLVHSPQEGTGRYSGYSDPEMDRLLERSFHPMPHGDRLELLRAAAEKVHAEVAAIPLYRQHDLWLVSDRLAFTPRPDRRIRVFEMALR